MRTLRECWQWKSFSHFSFLTHHSSKLIFITSSEFYFNKFLTVFITAILRTYGWRCGKQQQLCTGDVKRCFQNVNHLCEAIFGCFEDWCFLKPKLPTLARTCVYLVTHVRSCLYTYDVQTRPQLSRKTNWRLDSRK